MFEGKLYKIDYVHCSARHGICYIFFAAFYSICCVKYNNFLCVLFKYQNFE